MDRVTNRCSVLVSASGLSRYTKSASISSIREEEEENPSNAHRKHNFPRAQIFQALVARQEFALRWENGRDAYQILCCDAGVPERQLKGGQAFLVLADSLGKKDPLGDHVLGQFAIPPQVLGSNRKSNIANDYGSMKSRVLPKKEGSELDSGPTLHPGAIPCLFQPELLIFPALQT